MSENSGSQIVFQTDIFQKLSLGAPDGGAAVLKTCQTYIVQVNISQGPSIEILLFPQTTVNLFVQLYKCVLAAYICTAWETQQWTTVSPCPGGNTTTHTAFASSWQD